MKIQVSILPEECSEEEEFLISVTSEDEGSNVFACVFGNEGVYREMPGMMASVQEKPTDTWRTLVIEDGSLVGEGRAKWISKEAGKVVIDGKVWEFMPVLRTSLPEDVKEKLLKLTSQIHEHKDELEELDELFEKLDAYVKKVVNQRLVEIIEEEMKELESNSNMNPQEIRNCLSGGNISLVRQIVESTDLSMEEVLSAALDEFLYDIGYIEEKPDFNLEERRLE